MNDSFRGGVPIKWLMAGGPAETAGVKVGDIVIVINGQAINNIQDYLAAIAENDNYTMEVLRNGRELLTFHIELPKQKDGQTLDYAKVISQIEYALGEGKRFDN